VIVTSMLLLGGAATLNALTGMDTKLASFLVPWGMIVHTTYGGLQATCIASFFQTAVMFIILVACVYTVYIKQLSTDEVFLGLQEVGSYSATECQHIFSGGNGTFFEIGSYSCGAVVDNELGSYITMNSLGGLKFGIINIVGNFGTVFVDQSYWQSAVAGDVKSVHKGFFIGGMVWFTIPFAMATSLGLLSVSLQLPVSVAEAGAGLVPPAAATHLFGPFGAVMMCVTLIMAVGSTSAAECMAVSSLFVFDVYKVYINPNATSTQMMRVSRFVVVVFGFTMGVLSVILEYLELNLGWVYQFMGNAVGSAIVPLWNLLMWKDANATGAVMAAWMGLVLALISWFSAAFIQSGEITIDSLGMLEPNLVGNVVAISSSGLIHCAFSMAHPQNYNWKSMGLIELVDDDQRGLKDEDYAERLIADSRWWIQKWSGGFTILLVLVWPLLTLPAGVFGTDYFSFWILVSIAWSFVATFVIIMMPIYESMDYLTDMVNKFFRIKREVSNIE